MRKLLQVEYGTDCTQTDEEIASFLRTAPLRVGNAIVSSDKEDIFEESDASTSIHLLFRFAVHFIILPLESSFAVAAAQLHASLYEPAYSELKELFDAVLIVALVELAIGFKLFLWSCPHVGEIHAQDRTRGEPPQGARLGRPVEAAD